MSAPAAGAVEILTFGCRLNAYESEVMRGHAAVAGLSGAVIVNTCAVTAEAERQARQAIRRLSRERPDADIIVTGCAAQIDPAAYAAMPEVSRVIGNAEKLKAETWMDAGRGVAVQDIMTVRETAGHLTAGFDGKARAFIQVQNGCDHRCTFCIIPFGRGPARSVPIGARGRRGICGLVSRGFREIVLTGVDLTSYGPDLPGQPTLGQMMRRLLAQVPALDRLRLSSLDPVEIDADLWRLIEEEPRLMPHLHLSVQAGDDMVLKRMKRRHSRADAIALCDRARALRPGIVFGADLITGFPTETDAMFEQSLALVDECGLTWLHIFPYSARNGTSAARMPQVPMPVRRARAAALRAAGERRLSSWLAAQVGHELDILLEQPDLGRTPHYAPVRFDSPAGAVGSIVRSRITGAADGALHGESAARD